MTDADTALADFREKNHRLMEELDAKRTERLKAMRKLVPLHVRATRALVAWVRVALLALALTLIVAAIAWVWVALWRWVVG